MRRELAELARRQGISMGSFSVANRSRRRAYVSCMRWPASHPRSIRCQGELRSYQLQNRPETSDIGQLSGINGAFFGPPPVVGPAKTLEFSAFAAERRPKK